MHLVGVRITDAGRITLYTGKIIDGISQYCVHQYRKIEKKQEAGQELAAGFLLGKYLGVRSGVQIVRLRRGKPILKSGKNYFNLSHSRDYAVLALADIDIGVDIEQIKDVHWPTMRKVFTLGQREQLEQVVEAKRPELSTKCWTKCEAVLGLQGTGFTADTAMADARSGSTESEGGRRHLYVHSFKYKEYMTACTAYGEFDVSVKKNRSCLYM